MLVSLSEQFCQKNDVSHYTNENCERFYFYWDLSAFIQHSRFLALCIFSGNKISAPSPQVWRCPYAYDCALGLEYDPTRKIWTHDANEIERKEIRDGWKSFIHFKFRQDFFLSPTMLRYVALKCCDRLAGALSQSLDAVWVYWASHLFL